MRYSISITEDAPDTEMTIFMEDGGVVTTYHNGEHLLTEMYQDRVDIFDGEMFDRLGEGKMYVKPWKKKQTIDQEVIDHALEWLCPFCENFIHVEFYNLVSEYNHNQLKKQADL
jgi:hypothetical protein